MIASDKNMLYEFSYQNPHTHFIKVKLHFEATAHAIVSLPSWRPGRYQIQNFAKNIKYVRVEDEQGAALAIQKLSKDRWQLGNKAGKVTIYYEYYAFAMDAGNSWLDEEQLYINFINCALYVEGQMDVPCEVKLDVPADYRVATGLRQLSQHHFSCDSYYDLVDSPLIASHSLRQISYEVGGYQFHIWVQGELPKTDEEVVKDFVPFTQLQVDIMGGFPCPDYHFLLQCLPYKHYHGVEHLNSTVITLGPSEDLKDRKLYKELLGVSSHELFHTWNVIRLRPKEMTPYVFGQENYHKTGFVTEGVTTYYGDLFLARSGVFSLDEYLAELNKLLLRHYLNEGRKNYSVAASSYDLWLDGYERGIPGRKVSIYNEGALAALILDLKIRLKFDHEKSLDDVMRLMWQRHGQDRSGYTHSDYRQAAEAVYGDSLEDYFQEIIGGTTPYEGELAPLLSSCGLSFERKEADKPEERNFGLRLTKSGERYFIDAIAPDSQAESCLSLKDEILSINGQVYKGEWPVGSECHLEINRFGRKVDVTLIQNEQTYFGIYQVALKEADHHNLKSWLSL